MFGRRFIIVFLMLSFAYLMLACSTYPSQSPIQTAAIEATTVRTAASSSDLITRAVMADDTTCQLKDPGGVARTFPSTQNIFHAVITIMNAPTGTNVRVVWIVVDDGNSSEANSKAAEFELTAEGSRNLDFTFKPKAGALPPGKYRADVFLNGTLDRSLDFSVRENEPTPASSDVITDAVMASDSTCNQKDPVGVTHSFPAEQSRFHAVVSVSNAPKGTRVLVVWMAPGDANPSVTNGKMADYEIDTEGSRNLDFSFKPDSGRLPPGQYHADVYLNGTLFKTLKFTVSGP